MKQKPFKMRGFSGFGNSPVKKNQDFEPAFEGADMSRQEYEKKLKAFTKAGFSKKDATEFIGNGVSIAEAKKKRTNEFNFGKLRKKPTMLDTDFSGRFPNPG
tara:strand:+ start:661 stop:966 length:306 start_codon:yes stop_codon:yes gene_type:complete